jgi:hypothetical protein
MNVVERRRDAGQAGLFAATGVRPGVSDEEAKPQCFRPLDFILEGRDRLAIQVVAGGREVDELRIVSRQEFELRRLCGFPERVDLIIGQRLGGPLVRVLREQLNGATLQSDGGFDRLV